MKHLILTTIILLTTNLINAQDFSENDLIGKWIKVKQTDENGNEKEPILIPISARQSEAKPDSNQIEQILIFDEDGSCLSAFGTRQEIKEEFGRYNFELKGATLKIGSSTYEIIDLTQDKMVLKEKETATTLFVIHDHFERIK